MKIAIIGVTGRADIRPVGEVLRCSHRVTAIMRTASKLPVRAGFIIKGVDTINEAGLVAAFVGNGIVYSTMCFLQASADQIAGAVKKAAVPRLLVVGGAGSLEVTPGVALISTPQFPEEYLEEALAGRDFLSALRKETELNWTFVSLSAILEPDEHTGRFRVGKDSLPMDTNNKSRISIEDYAIAFLDETGEPAHPRQRSMVGY